MAAAVSPELSLALPCPKRAEEGLGLGAVPLGLQDAEVEVQTPAEAGRHDPGAAPLEPVDALHPPPRESCSLKILSTPRRSAISRSTTQARSLSLPLA